MAGRGQWLERFGGRLARFLTAPRPGKGAAPVSGLGSWLPYLKPGDVLLVEGSSRISTAIKYLTQSTWSHAALVLGPHPGPRDPTPGPGIPHQAQGFHADPPDSTLGPGIPRWT